MDERPFSLSPDVLQIVLSTIRESLQSAKHEIVRTEEPGIWRILSGCEITAKPITSAGASAKVSWYAGIDAVIDFNESEALTECLDKVEGPKGVFISLDEGAFGEPTIRSGRFLVPDGCEGAHDVGFSFSVKRLEFEKEDQVFRSRQSELEEESLPPFSGKIIIASKDAV